MILNLPSNHRPESAFRALCVDEDPSFLKILRLTLVRHGIDVVTTAPGVDAFTQFQAHDGQFQVILVNHDRCGAQTLDFVRQARAVGYRGQILVMAGAMSPSALQAYMDHGISGFLSKPFDIGMIATLLLSRA